MTHDQTTPAPVEVTQADESRALEIFNEALGDMGSFAEYGSPSYQDGALRTIALHCARHRIDHSAPADLVEALQDRIRVACGDWCDPEKGRHAAGCEAARTALAKHTRAQGEG